MPASSTSISERPARSRVRTLLLWAARLCVAVVLSLGLFEAHLRMPPFRVGVSPVVYDPVLGYWHKPGYQGQSFSACYEVPYSFDGAGLRPARSELPGKPLSGKKAIIIGDSQVEAVMVQDDQVLHQRLQARLGDRIEVLNYGLAGSGADLQYLILKDRGQLAEIGWVVQLVSLDSDVYEADPRNDKPGQRPRARLMFDDPADLDHYRLIPPAPYTRAERFRDVFANFQLYSYSRAALVPLRRLVRTLRQAMAPARATAATSAPAAEPVPAIPTPSAATGPSELAWTNLVGAVRLNRQLVEASGARYLPLVWSRDPTLFREWQRRTAPLGIEGLALGPALAAAGADLDQLSFSCDHHFTAATHDRIAAVLAKSGFFDR